MTFENKAALLVQALRDDMPVPHFEWVQKQGDLAEVIANASAALRNWCINQGYTQFIRTSPVSPTTGEKADIAYAAVTTDGVASVTTEDDTPAVLYAMPLHTNKSYGVRGQVTARVANGKSAYFTFYALPENTSGTGRLVASVTPTVVARDSAISGAAIAVTAAEAGDYELYPTMIITVTGVAATVIVWECKVEASEL